MKVLKLVYGLLNPSAGGPPAVSRNLLEGFYKIEKGLSKKGIDVTFLSIDSNTCNITSSNGSINVSCIRNVPFSIILSDLYIPLLNYIKMLKPDIVHSHIISGISLYALSRMPTVLTLHGNPQKEFLFEKRTYVRSYFIIFEEKLKRISPFLSKIVALTPSMAKELVMRGYSKDKIAIIGNPVSVRFYEAKKKEEQIILYPARLHPLKNQLGFLRAASFIRDELKDWKIYFAGSGDEKYKSLILNYARNRGLTVELLGRFPYSEMHKLYARSAIVALTSFQEVLPMTILEAMASATPIIASNLPTLGDIINDGVNGFLVDPYDAKEIADKLSILVGDKSLRKKMGSIGRNLSIYFRSDIIAKKYIKLYEGLCEESIHNSI